MPSPAVELRDFSAAPWRGRLEAWLLDVAHVEPDAVVDRKREVIGGMRGTVVEVGPGPGTNLGYYAPGVRVLAVEPNPAMHPRLRRHAAELGVDLAIHGVHGEVMDLADGIADGVVGTLVLCGVDDPAAVLAEIRRVLRPGGTYLFYEHVRAPEGTATRLAQRVLKVPHRWLFNGCEVDRGTGALLADAGFAEVRLEEVDAGPAAAHTRTRIIGTATRA